MHRLAVRDLDVAHRVFGGERDRLEAEWVTDPPDSTTAFKLTDDAEAEWTARLEAMPLEDRRPPWVRRQWRRWDRQAGLAGLAGLAGRAAR